MPDADQIALIPQERPMFSQTFLELVKLVIPDEGPAPSAKLRESVKAVGIFQPILVAPRDDGRYRVIDGRRRTLARLSGLVWVSGETGLLSLEVEPRTRTVWACHGATTAAGPEVRVTRWRADRSWRRLSHRRTVVAGLPASRFT